jgi:hypothetical protein
MRHQPWRPLTHDSDMRADSFLVRAEGALKTALRLQAEQSRCWQGVID